MRSEAYIDIQHRQQLKQFLQKLKQVNRNKKNISTNIK